METTPPVVIRATMGQSVSGQGDQHLEREGKRQTQCSLGLPRWLVVKTLPANVGGEGDPGSSPESVRASGWRARQPSAALSPGEPQGQRSLVGCSPWGRKESDTTDHTHKCSPMCGSHAKLCISNIRREPGTSETGPGPRRWPAMATSYTSSQYH